MDGRVANPFGPDTFMVSGAERDGVFPRGSLRHSRPIGDSLHVVDGRWGRVKEHLLCHDVRFTFPPAFKRTADAAQLCQMVKPFLLSHTSAFA